MAKYKKFIFASDNHGNLAEPSALSAVLQFKKHFKPDVTIHGGDLFDFTCLRKGASKDEEFEDLAPDIEAGMDFLRKLKPDIYLRGNHCERLWDGAVGLNPVLSRFCSNQITEIMEVLGGAEMFPYDKRAGVFKLGRLHFLHGYQTGIHVARALALVYQNAVCGHVHSIDQASIPGLETRTGFTAGCLCRLSHPYNRTHVATLRQAHGFVYGWASSTGDYQLFQARTFDGAWHFPTEFITVGAKNAS